MIEVKDIVKVIVDGANIPYSVEYLLANTIGMLPDSKKETIWSQLGREDDLTSNFFFEYGTADIYTSGVYLKFEGPSSRTSASYFVDLNGMITRKQRGELLHSYDFYADSGYINWGKLEGYLDYRDFNGIDAKIEKALHSEDSEIVGFLSDSTVKVKMALSNLFIKDYEIGILRYGLGVEKYDKNTHTAISEKEFKDIEWVIKNRDINSILDRYDTNRMGVEFEFDRNFVRMTIPTNSRDYAVVVDFDSWYLNNLASYPIGDFNSRYALINMDYVSIHIEDYSDFVINGVSKITGSQLVNYLNSTNIDYELRVRNDSIEVELDDFIYDDVGNDMKKFVMESSITNSMDMVEEIVK